MKIQETSKIVNIRKDSSKIVTGIPCHLKLVEGSLLQLFTIHFSLFAINHSLSAVTNVLKDDKIKFNHTLEDVVK